MEEKNFSPEQSLRLISEMINKTRQNISDNTKYFLLWGWLTVAAITGQYILKVLVRYERHYLVWFVLFLGVAISVFWGMRDGKKVRVKTYVDESMKYLWSGMGISFFVLSMLFIKIGYQYCYPFFILMYGLGTFISGKILQFKPFVVGGMLAWVLSMVAVLFSFDKQMLFAVVALLVSYIIPAHLFRIHQQKQKA
jgi:hypothetical protein